MRNTLAVLCTTLIAASLGGCDARPEGQLHVETSGSLELIHTVRFTTESQDWDLRVDCLLEGGLRSQTLHVRAYDNTFEDGFDIDLFIDDFESDGSYHRTFNQPNPALWLTLVDDDTDRWTLDTSGGGTCDFEVEYGGRQGTYECEDVAGDASGAATFEDVAVSGSWTCTGLYWNDFGYEDGHDRDDDVEELDDDWD